MKILLLSFILLGLYGFCLGAGGGGVSSSTSSGGGRFTDDRITYSGSHFVAAGEKFTITCIFGVDDYLLWTHNGEPIVPGTSGYTMMHGPGRQGYMVSRLTVVRAYSFHTGEYSCIGVPHKTHSVFVSSGSMKETEDTKRLREGRPLILTCEQNATNLETKWTKDGNELVAGDHIQLFPNTTLYISTAQKEDKGEYSCKTGSMTEPKIFHVVELTLQKHLPKSTTVLENDKLSLSCQVQGDPELTVQWLKDGEPVEDTDNSTRLEMSDNEYDVPNAVLSIKPIQKSDSGNYVCLISLYSINVNTTTVVRVKDIYAALWPFLGIVAEVVILCLIIFIYEKRRIKANFDDSDSDPAQDVKNNVDGKKENDIRQRKH